MVNSVDDMVSLGRMMGFQLKDIGVLFSGLICGAAFMSIALVILNSLS